MRILPIGATDQDIKALVIEWSELLAQKRYEDALAMFALAEEDFVWTPELLQQVIAGYGVIESDSEVLRHLLAHHGVERFEITTLTGRPDKDDIINDKIDVDRQHLFGLVSTLI